MKIKTTNSSLNILSVCFRFICILLLQYIIMYTIMFYVRRILELFLTECGQVWFRDEGPRWSYDIMLAGRLVYCLRLRDKRVWMIDRIIIGRRKFEYLGKSHSYFHFVYHMSAPGLWWSLFCWSSLWEGYGSQEVKRWGDIFLKCLIVHTLVTQYCQNLPLLI
jgi:hypothetical protein